MLLCNLMYCCAYFVGYISALVSIKRVSVGLSGVYYGKMADWIWILLGMMSGVSQGMGALDGVVIVKGKGQFWGEFGASHCNQWGLCGIVVRD